MKDHPSEAEAASPSGELSVRLAPSSGTDELPLRGKTILVTRARHQAGRLSEELRAYGAEVVEIPAIEILPPDSFEALDRALRQIIDYQWLIVTSANGARAVQERMNALALGGERFAHLQIAAIGAATARALQDAGLQVTVTPPEYVAESLLETLEERMRGQRVLLARAAVARDVIPDTLRASGAQVDVIDAYRTVIPPDSVEKIRRLFAHDHTIPDAATFTSSSTVSNFLALFHEAKLQIPFGFKAVSIGPVTSRTLRESGLEPAEEAAPHDLSGLVQAVLRALASPQ